MPRIIDIALFYFKLSNRIVRVGTSKEMLKSWDSGRDSQRIKQRKKSIIKEQFEVSGKELKVEQFSRHEDFSNFSAVRVSTKRLCRPEMFGNVRLAPKCTNLGLKKKFPNPEFSNLLPIWPNRRPNLTSLFSAVSVSADKLSVWSPGL